MQASASADARPSTKMVGRLRSASDRQFLQGVLQQLQFEVATAARAVFRSWLFVQRLLQQHLQLREVGSRPWLSFSSSPNQCVVLSVLVGCDGRKDSFGKNCRLGTSVSAHLNQVGTSFVKNATDIPSFFGSAFEYSFG